MQKILEIGLGKGKKGKFRMLTGGVIVWPSTPYTTYVCSKGIAAWLLSAGTS